MGLFPTVDLALSFDPTGFCCDLVIADGDLALDDTPVTPMLVSLGSDRRANADDELPEGLSPLTTPVAWDPRRGWVGDCLDPAGRRIGSRWWLLSREHQADRVAERARLFTDEALGWAHMEMGITPEISVEWVRPNVLGLAAYIDGRSVTLTKKVQ